MKTMGEVYPRLLELPGYEEIAARPFVPPAPPPEPSLVAKAASFATAVVKQAVSGNPIAPKEVQDRRRETCFSCEKFHDHANDKCRSCGCSLMETKRSWATSVCPEGFW